VRVNSNFIFVTTFLILVLLAFWKGVLDFILAFIIIFAICLFFEGETFIEEHKSGKRNDEPSKERE